MSLLCCAYTRILACFLVSLLTPFFVVFAKLLSHFRRTVYAQTECETAQDQEEERVAHEEQSRLGIVGHCCDIG